MSDTKARSASVTASETERADVLKRIISAQDAYIAELEPRLYSLQQENTALRQQCKALQEENQNMSSQRITPQAATPVSARKSSSASLYRASFASTTASPSPTAAAAPFAPAPVAVSTAEAETQCDATAATSDAAAADDAQQIAALQSQLAILAAEKQTLFEELQRIQVTSERRLREAQEESARWQSKCDENGRQLAVAQRQLEEVNRSHSAEHAALESSYVAEVNALRAENEALRQLARDVSRTLAEDEESVIIHTEKEDKKEQHAAKTPRSQNSYAHRASVSSHTSAPISPSVAGASVSGSTKFTSSIIDDTLLTPETSAALAEFLAADVQLHMDESMLHVNTTLLTLGEEREREFANYVAKMGESKIAPFANQPTAWPVEFQDQIIQENLALRDRCKRVESDLSNMQSEFNRLKTELAELHAARAQVRALQAENDRLNAQYVHAIDTLKAGPVLVTRTEDLDHVRRVRDLSSMLESTYSIKSWFDSSRQKVMSEIKNELGELRSTIDTLTKLNVQLKKEVARQAEDKKKYMREVQKLRAAVGTLEAMNKTAATPRTNTNRDKVAREKEKAIQDEMELIQAEMRRENEQRNRQLAEENTRLKTELQYKDLHAAQDMQQLKTQLAVLQRRMAAMSPQS